jgi:hypothetical protein
MASISAAWTSMLVPRLVSVSVPLAPLVAVQWSCQSM